MIAAFMRIPVDTRRILYAATAAIVLFAIGEGVHPGFLAPSSIESVLVIASFVGLVAAGQTFVILIGGIDLSVPWVINAGAVALVVSSMGRPDLTIVGVLAALGTGLLAGVANGVGVAIFNVPPVVMTLAMNGIVEGLVLGLTGGFTCSSCASYAPPAIEGIAHGTLLGIPGELWLWAAIALAISVILGATRFGRSTYALGTNRYAAFLAGVNVRMMTILLFGLSGLFASLAGIMLTGFGGQASLSLGQPYLFTSIAAAVIGGVNILGGRGHYLGAVAGAISLTVLVSVLLALNMPDYVRSIVYGVVILALLLAYGREAEA